MLDRDPVASLDDYVALGGGVGLDAARRLGATAVIEEVAAAGLRGRGGAGFPTARKWATVAAYGRPEMPRTVVVNGAEGEPGTFKDRAILRANPYLTVEGALIAALAIGGADRVVIALKSSFERERDRIAAAIREVDAAGWTEGVVGLDVFSGPEEYLYGEETGLLESLNGRVPFPRLAPPYRHGADEVGPDRPAPAGTELTAPRGTSGGPPTLVNNVETLAHVARIVAHGADWFREMGTEDSPGTIVCTVSGDTVRAGVGEFAMGTPLRQIVDGLGGGMRPGRAIAAVLPGVANAILPPALLGTPATYEDLKAVGSGLGSCGFLVFDDAIDPVAVALGAARFLAVESCGQCTPCKGDGLDIAEALDRLIRSEPEDDDVDRIVAKLQTIPEGARCFLAHQHQAVVQSLLQAFPEAFEARAAGRAAPADPVLIAPLLDVVNGRAVIDERHANKQPDWSFDEEWSGEWPAEEVDVRAQSVSR